MALIDAVREEIDSWIQSYDDEKVNPNYERDEIIKTSEKLLEENMDDYVDKRIKFEKELDMISESVKSYVDPYFAKYSEMNKRTWDKLELSYSQETIEAITEVYWEDKVGDFLFNFRWYKFLDEDIVFILENKINIGFIHSVKRNSIKIFWKKLVGRELLEVVYESQKLWDEQKWKVFIQSY